MVSWTHFQIGREQFFYCRQHASLVMDQPILQWDWLFDSFPGLVSDLLLEMTYLHQKEPDAPMLAKLGACSSVEPSHLKLCWLQEHSLPGLA